MEPRSLLTERLNAWEAVALSSMAANALLAILLLRPRGADAPSGAGGTAAVAEPATRGQGGTPGDRRMTPCEERVRSLEAKLANPAASDRPGSTAATNPRDWDGAFEKGKANPTAEGKLRAEIERVFRANGLGDLTYALECRDLFCRMEIVTRPDEQDLESKWMDLLQGKDDQLRNLYEGIGFTSPDVGHDPVSKEAIEKHRITFALADPSAARGIDIVREFLRSHGDPALAECARRHPTAQGDLVLIAEVERGWEQVRVQVGGSVAGMDLGACVRQQLEAAAAALKVPDNVTPARTFRNVEFPFGTDANRPNSDG